jgi:Rrf2 family protein
MISLTGEYALRAVVCLASHPGQALTTEVISQLCEVPVGYLAKIMQSLTRAGLVTSQRGPHGGFALVRCAAEISLYDVIRAADQLPRHHEPPAPALAKGRLSLLHRHLDDARASTERGYRTTTIAQLLAEAGDDGAVRPSQEAP